MREILIKIKEVLAQKLDAYLADSVIRVTCKRLGTTPDEISIGQLLDFTEKVKISLLLFLGEKEVEEIIQRLKKIKEQ